MEPLAVRIVEKVLGGHAIATALAALALGLPMRARAGQAETQTFFGMAAY